MSGKRLLEEFVGSAQSEYRFMECVGSTELDQQRLYDALERRVSDEMLIESHNRVKSSRLVAIVTFVATVNMAVAAANILFWQSAMLSVSVFVVGSIVIAISLMSNKKLKEHDRVHSLDGINTMLVRTDVADAIHDSYDNETADSPLLREELRDVCSLYSQSTEKPGPETLKAIERLIAEKQMALENNTAVERNRKKLELEERDAGQAKAITEVYGEGVEKRGGIVDDDDDMKPSLKSSDDESGFDTDSLFAAEYRARRELDERK